jgi:hypothetical protein
MNRIFVHGVGAVSSAGWGVAALQEAIEGVRQPAPSPIQRPDKTSLTVFRVPAPTTRPAWLMHPRLRRSSPISHYTVAAALEALGLDAATADKPGLGVIVSVMGGSVQYSRRFYAEVLANPSLASPLLFPETVFNAPASHLGAVLGTSARNDTCVSDQTGFLTALATAAGWIEAGEVESCIVAGAEEADWITAEASRCFSKRVTPAEGAAAVLLSREPAPVELVAISSPRPYVRNTRRPTAEDVCADLGIPPGSPAYTQGFHTAADSHIAVDRKLGDGLGAGGGWACVAAIDALIRGRSDRACVCVAGSNQQAAGALFISS